ncbi:hypothetical protein HD554DRAFT_1579092 [Boletus coccyginus]|nr:hypothetical protein HD554DRAFT_1579092 [Boletus coccyginus]
MNPASTTAAVTNLWSTPQSDGSAARSKDPARPEGGAPVHYLIVTQELTPITKLVGDPFLSCWWDAVKCHLTLWRSGVHHRNISVANLMYEVKGSRVVGALIDFDLAMTVGSATGNECTGTVPFMALDLLTKEGLAGEIEHIYAYDAESFIWVLVWICLRYDNGELRKDDRPLDKWLKVDVLEGSRAQLARCQKVFECIEAVLHGERAALAKNLF